MRRVLIFIALMLAPGCSPATPELVPKNGGKMLTRIEKSLILATFFRGGSLDQRGWSSSSDEILTLSLFYTGDISEADCVERFSNRGYVGRLYQEVDVESRDESPELTDEIRDRYRVLIKLLLTHPELIEGGGDFEYPAHPTFTACRLTEDGFTLAEELVGVFPQKPDFANWPDKRVMPAAD